jgi:serine/threonine protein kinase
VIGKTLGHYAILVKIGAGGMGEVYQARDTRLDRLVAIKVLPEGRASNRDAAERFDREARTIASLTHPNICTLFDVGVHDGLPFLVMELLDGDTLADLLRTGPLPGPDVLRIAAQIARALAAAHARNVVHRDLKPANVKITVNGAKVLDFGLAKFSAAETRPASLDFRTGFATAAHTVVGTAPYMSPEQARGDEVDYRTDCWSFGVLLYEMLTGTPLFTGGNSLSVISAILTQPVDLARLPVSTPTPVRQLLSGLLQRNRDSRLRDLAEVAGVLESVDTGKLRSSAYGDASASVTPAVPSIVVLPFTNRSPDVDNEYFSDGLTEEIIADLSKVGALRVISKTTAMRLKQTEMDLAGMAATLNVRYALEGSVRKAGSSLRITAQLVDMATDSALWSDKFSGTLDEVFDIQERVSRAIVKALRVQLTDREDRRLRAPTTPNGYVYDTYLRARRDIWSFMPERLARVEEELTRALAAAGEHVLLYDGLGTLHWQYINSGISGDRHHLAEAERYARKIMELDPVSATGPRLIGLIAAQSGDGVGWVRHLEHAASIEPHDPYTVIWLAYGWTWAGFPGRSRPLYDRLLAIDPYFDYLLFGLGFEAYFAGDYTAAERHYEKARQLSPDHPGIVMVLAQTFASAGQLERMVRWVDASAPDPHAHPLHTLSHLFKHALVGDAAAADALTSADLESQLWSDFQYTHVMAQAQAALGRPKEAVRWLARSAERGLLNYPFLSGRDPLIGRIRGNQDLESLLERIRWAWETFEARVAARAEGTVPADPGEK